MVQGLGSSLCSHPVGYTGSRKGVLPMTTDQNARPLERALLFSLVIHALAMLSMALLLMDGIPGAEPDLAARMAYVAGHPWLWRLGWLPWQLTALSGLLLPEPWPPALWQVGLANGVGFTLMLIWMGAVLELLLRRSRPDAAHGRYVPWVCPTGRRAGRLVGAVADSRLLRALAIAGDARPFCFRVAAVPFRFEREEYDRVP